MVHFFKFRLELNRQCLRSPFFMQFRTLTQEYELAPSALRRCKLNCPPSLPLAKRAHFLLQVFNNVTKIFQESYITICIIKCIRKVLWFAEFIPSTLTAVTQIFLSSPIHQYFRTHVNVIIIIIIVWHSLRWVL